MTELKDTITIDVNANKEEVANILKQYKYTRYPITRDNEIIGLLNIKDLIIKKMDNFNLNNYVREIPKIESNTIIDDAFLMLSSSHQVMARVIENNKFIGIITIEDILEEIIGNVFDEYN